MNLLQLIKKKSLMYIVMACSLGACMPFDELNTDPTLLTDANPGTFLNPTLYGLASYNWSRYNSFTFPVMQSVVSTSSISGTGWWLLSDAVGDGTWTTYYKWLNNIEAIYAKGVSYEKPNYQAVALTLKCWIYQMLADSFGDVPMTEACRGGELLLTPAFDSQLTIYRNLIDMLDEANSLYDTTSGLIYNSSGDLLYQTGKTEIAGLLKWQKFTNSLRMRVLLRVAEVDGLNAKAELKAMVANPDKYPVFTSNDDAAALSISGVAPEEAPMTRPQDFNSYKVYSEFFIDPLNAWNDPRRSVFCTQATNDGVKGYYGIESGYAILPSKNASQPNQGFCVAPMKLQMMSYAEVEFILAELAQKGITNEDASQHYRNGVTAAITHYGLEMPADYFDNKAADYDGTLDRIMQQKFYALFFCDQQQWFEYNRTGLPHIPRGSGIATGNNMPSRYKYPMTIQRTNMKNYQSAKENMGGDDFSIPLIWHKR